MRQHRHAIVSIHEPRPALGAFDVARHPIQMVGGAAQHQASSTQVSLVPPPCEELTTSEPSRKATRVSPPGTIVTSRPDSTKGRKSMWRGARFWPAKVGQVDRARVGCAM